MPNHIIAFDTYDNTTPALMRAARTWPGVVGTQVRVPWRDLERRAGEYTFEIFDDLSTEELKSLTLMIVDRVYNHANKPSVQQPLPDHMAPLALPTIDNGRAARRWSLYFQSRFNALAETPAPLTSADRCLLGHTAELLAQALDDAYTCGANITPPAESNVRVLHTDTTRAINAALRARNKLPQRPAAPIVGVPFTTGPDAA